MDKRWADLDDDTDLFDLLGAVLRDPLQLGLLLGACAGALAMAAASARRAPAGRAIPARGSLQITPTKDDVVARASQAADATMQRILSAPGDETPTGLTIL
jgi:hypothetical protein